MRRDERDKLRAALVKARNALKVWSSGASNRPDIWTLTREAFRDAALALGETGPRYDHPFRKCSTCPGQPHGIDASGCLGAATCQDCGAPKCDPHRTACPWYGTHEIRRFTTYPFAEMGDPTGQAAEVREVVVLSYDGNKYVRVRLPNGAEAEVKRGYLHETAEAAYEAEWSR